MLLSAIKYILVKITNIEKCVAKMTCSIFKILKIIFNVNFLFFLICVILKVRVNKYLGKKFEKIIL